MQKQKHPKTALFLWDRGREQPHQFIFKPVHNLLGNLM